MLKSSLLGQIEVANLPTHIQSFVSLIYIHIFTQSVVSLELGEVGWKRLLYVFGIIT